MKWLCSIISLKSTIWSALLLYSALGCKEAQTESTEESPKEVVPAMVWHPVEGLDATIFHNSIQANPLSPKTIWVAVDTVLLVSYNGGKTFPRTVYIPGHRHPSVSQIFIHPSDTNLVFISGWGGFFKSTDYGNTWNPGIPGEQFIDFDGESLAMELNNPDMLYIGLYANADHPDKIFFKSVDRGNTWQNIEVSAIKDATLIETRGFCCLTALGNGVLLSGNRIVSANVTLPAMLRSNDYGVTWTEVGKSYQGTAETPKIIQNRKNLNEVYATHWGFNGSDVNGSIDKSSDYGVTWSEVFKLGGYNPWPIVSDSKGTIYIASTESNNNGIFYTSDGGATWQEGAQGIIDKSESNFLNMKAVMDGNDEYIYVAGRSVYYTLLEKPN